MSARGLIRRVVDRRSGEIELAIELDDKSHRQKQRRACDRFVNRVCAQAEVPLLRVPTAGRYDREELRARLAQIQSR